MTRPLRQFRRFGKDKNTLAPQEIKLGFIGTPSSILVAIPTELTHFELVMVTRNLLMKYYQCDTQISQHKKFRDSSTSPERDYSLKITPFLRLIFNRLRPCGNYMHHQV